MASASFISYGPKRVLEYPDSRNCRKSGGASLRLATTRWSAACIPRSICTSQSKSLGRLWAGVEIVLDQREHIILQPDITFIVDGRESIVRDRVWGPPDMVLDVTSPLTHPGQLQERIAWFSLYGVREYWLVQPQPKNIAILELAHGAVRRRRLFDEFTPVTSPLLPSSAAAWGVSEIAV